MLASCAHCSSEFYSQHGSMYCSSYCRYAARDARTKRFPCAGCGEPMWTGGKGSLPEGEAMHRRCKPGYGEVSTHGASGYRRGCRCDECRAALAAERRNYVRKRLSDGVDVRAKYRHPLDRRYWISRVTRQEIYERDGWVCQICYKPVDRDAPVNSRLSASLDHIVPSSHLVVPDHSPSNLRLAHMSCNAMRGNRDDGAGKPGAARGGRPVG